MLQVARSGRCFYDFEGEMSGEYGPETLDQLQNLVRAGLSRWALSPRTEIRLLNVSENATFRLDDPEADRPVVVRVHRENYHSEAEIVSELAWICALRERGIVDTPAPVADVDGKCVQRLAAVDGGMSRFAVAFEFAPGREPDSSHDLPAWFRELGKITAHMHRHARSWDRPATFRRKTWDFDLMLGGGAIWGRWQDGTGLDAASRDLLGRTVGTIEKRLGRFGAGGERFGLIHADLRLANLLVDDRSMRVIDFDDCGFGWFVYDFASAVSFFEDDPIVPVLAAAWAEGYRAVAPLSAEDEAEIPVFVMLRRILLVAWIATHQHSPMGGEAGVRYTRDSVAMADDFLLRFA